MNGELSVFSGKNASFPTTRWTQVREAGAGSDAALAELCQRYWTPVCVFLRRSGCDREEAREMTQSFFERLLEQNLPARARADKGRFRNFLLTAARNHLRNVTAKAHAARRDERQTCALEEVEEGAGAAVEGSPETAFDQSWAQVLIAQTRSRLATAESAAGRAEVFQVLEPFLLADPEPGEYAEISQRTGRSVGSIKTGVFRLRQRFREAFREEVAETLNDRADIDGEIRHLIAALGTSRDL